MISIRETSGSCQELGILAVALHALEDFSPWVSPAGRGLKTAIIATCPVCGVDEPAAVDALRVVQVGKADEPQRLSWFCYAHNGNYRGIGAALRKHEAEKPRERTWTKHESAQVCKLVPTEKNSVGTKSNAAPEVDLAAKEYRCTSPGLLLNHLTKSDYLEAMSVRCRRCPACCSWLKACRISRLRAATSDWASVFMVETQGPAEYAALTAKLRRHNLKRRTGDIYNPVRYESVPVDGGRETLTNDSTVAGLYRPIHDVTAAITSLVNRMAPGGRVSGSANKPKKNKELQKEKETDDKEPRVRIAVVKVSASEAADIIQRHGVPKVVADPEEVLKRGRTPRQKWDLSALDSDARLALFLALGIRVWSGTTTRGAALDVAA